MQSNQILKCETCGVGLDPTRDIALPTQTGGHICLDCLDRLIAQEEEEI